MTDEELRQADLSQLSVREMTPAQRAELKRRYQTFIANFQPDAAAKLPAAAATEPKPKKWVPAKRAAR